MHLSILEGVARPLRDAVLRQPEEVRAAADRHLPRAADRARQVDLQVELDPRHGRVLRRRTCSSPSRRRPPAASTACSSRPATSRRRRRRPRAPSAPIASSSSPTARRPPTRWSYQALLAAGRHRDRRPQLPQVAPLRHGAGGRAAALRRGLPDDGSTRCTARCRCAAIKKALLDLQGRGPARPGEDGRR